MEKKNLMKVSDPDADVAVAGGCPDLVGNRLDEDEGDTLKVGLPGVETRSILIESEDHPISTTDVQDVVVTDGESGKAFGSLEGDRVAMCGQRLKLRKIRGLQLKGFIVDRVLFDFWKDRRDGRVKVDRGIRDVAHLGKALDNPCETRSTARISPPALFYERGKLWRTAFLLFGERGPETVLDGR